VRYIYILYSFSLSHILHLIRNLVLHTRVRPRHTYDAQNQTSATSPWSHQIMLMLTIIEQKCVDNYDTPQQKIVQSFIFLNLQENILYDDYHDICKKISLHSIQESERLFDFGSNLIKYQINVSFSISIFFLSVK